MKETLVFYIAHYRNNESACILLNYCVKSVNQHYPEASIVVCESPSTYVSKAYDISGVVWIDNPIPNSSCIGCLKDYLKRYCDTNMKAVFLHDSMILKGRFEESRLALPFGFIWHFSKLHEVKEIQSILIKTFMFNILVSADMDVEDYSGCFGPALYGNYKSIETLWNEIPFEDFMRTEQKLHFIVDMERTIGVTAFHHGLVKLTEEFSLCGDIFDFPNAFFNIFTKQTYEEIQNFPYEQACVKFWGGRTFLL
jgi:hypothetical protein